MMNSQQHPSNLQRSVPTSTQGSSLADILERVKLLQEEVKALKVLTAQKQPEETQ